MSWRVIVVVSVACLTAATAVSAVFGADADRSTALARIVGTKAANVLRGTAKADFIDGRAGNDTLYGLGGNDRLVGGTGADRIVCGRGLDTVTADRRDTVARDCEVVNGRPTPPPLSEVPEPLVGTWMRNITDGAVIGDDHRGVWKISFDRAGIVILYEPEHLKTPLGGPRMITATVSLTSDGKLRFPIGIGCPMEGTYNWEVAEGVLTFRVSEDRCALRAHVIPGDWSRAG